MSLAFYIFCLAHHYSGFFVVDDIVIVVGWSKISWKERNISILLCWIIKKSLCINMFEPVFCEMLCNIQNQNRYSFLYAKHETQQQQQK